MAKPKTGSDALHDVRVQQLGEVARSAAAAVSSLNASLDQGTKILAEIDEKKIELKKIDEGYANGIKVLEQRRLWIAEEADRLDKISQEIYRAMQRLQNESEKLQEVSGKEGSP